MKRFAALLTMTTLCAALCACTGGTEPPEAVDDFNVSILDAGKADAIILRTAEHTAVIDCGEKGDGKKIVSALETAGIDTIDYLFITHFDKDHVGGAAKVINSLNIGTIYVPNYQSEIDEYTAFTDAADAKGYTITTLTKDMSITIDDTLFKIYPPKRTAYEESDNDFSLAIHVSHGEDTLFFAGDAESERITELLQLRNIESDFLKVPHHGVLEKNTDALIEKIKPQYAAITCSQKNPADEEVLDLLQTAGCETYLTENGDITVISTGHGLKVTQSMSNM